MVEANLKNGGTVVTLPSPLDPDAGCNEMQAAIFLGVSVRTLQAWRVRGEGPSYLKVGRSVRYTRRQLVDFQKMHTIDSSTRVEGQGNAS